MLKEITLCIVNGICRTVGEVLHLLVYLGYVVLPQGPIPPIPFESHFSLSLDGFFLLLCIVSLLHVSQLSNFQASVL